MSIDLVPRLSIEGRGLTLTRRTDTASGPFVTLEQFQVAGTPLGLLRRHVDLVTVDGYEVRVKRGGPKNTSVERVTRHDVSIDEITVRNGLLLILPRNPEKLPLQFDLERVMLEDFGFDRPSTVSRAADEPEAARVHRQHRHGRSVGRRGTEPDAAGGGLHVRARRHEHHQRHRRHADVHRQVRGASGAHPGGRRHLRPRLPSGDDEAARPAGDEVPRHGGRHERRHLSGGSAGDAGPLEDPRHGVGGWRAQGQGPVGAAGRAHRRRAPRGRAAPGREG